MSRVALAALAGAISLIGGGALAQMYIGAHGGMMTWVTVPRAPTSYDLISGSSSYSYSPSIGYAARRAANKPCTEVRLEGLPPNATIDTVQVFTIFNAPKNTIKPDEEAVIAACHARSVARGAVAATASGAEGSPEIRVAELVMQRLPEGILAKSDVALVPDFSRLTLHADEHGVATIFIPRENVATNSALMRGYAIGALGFMVRAMDSQGQVTGQSSPVLLGDATLLNKEKVAVSLSRGAMAEAVAWTDGQGTTVHWTGRRFDQLAAR